MNKRKLAAVIRDSQEEYPRDNLSRGTSASRIIEYYMTQVSEKIEGRVTKRIYQIFSIEEDWILSALFKLYEFLLNSQIHKSESNLESYRESSETLENLECNEDGYQNDPHPEVGFTVNTSPHSLSSDPDAILRSNETFLSFMRAS